MIVLTQPKAGGYSESLNKPALPLALLNCARLLNQEFEVKIIDQRLSQWKTDLLKNLKQNPLCVGMTSITGPQIEHALEVSRFVKEHSDALVVWGGSHASLLPEQTLESSFVDVVVKGEGEVTFFELVKALKKGKSLKGVKGVWYKKGGKVYSNPNRPFVDLNKLPELPYHLINIKTYTQIRGGKKTVCLQTSRGCPYSCNFCFNQTYYKSHLRVFSTNKVIDNITFLKEFGINHFWVVDDNFFADVKRAKCICKRIVTERLDTSWDFPGSSILDLTKFNNFRLLEKTGCGQLYLGVESGSNKILRFINKNITYEQVLRFNRVIKRFNISPWYNFMVGFPGETNEDIKSTFSLILQLLKENRQTKISPIYAFTPYPGTKLFDIALKSGLTPPRTLEGWSCYDWKTINLPWITEKNKAYFGSLYFWSLFLDGKYEFELSNPLFKRAIKIFLPILKKIAMSKIENF